MATTTHASLRRTARARGYARRRLVDVFAIVMLSLGAVAMVLPRRPGTGAAPAPRGPLPSVAVGGSLGFLTGLLGVGGGVLAVPALTLAVRLAVRDAIGTSLLVIALNSAVALLAHWAQAGGEDSHGAGRALTHGRLPLDRDPPR